MGQWFSGEHQQIGFDSKHERHEIEHKPYHKQSENQ